MNDTIPNPFSSSRGLGTTPFSETNERIEHLADTANPREPSLTVWLQSHNQACFLAQALASVEAQTAVDLELIVTDNASTDGSADIIRAFARDRTWVRYYLFSDNPGPNVRFDFVVERARGVYLADLAADDTFSARSLRDIIDSAFRHNADLVHFGIAENYFRDDGSLERRSTRRPSRLIVAETAEEVGACLPMMFSECHIASEATLLRRVSFMRTKGIRMRDHMEDGPYVAALVAACERYVAVPIVAYEYRAYSTTEQARRRQSASFVKDFRPTFLWGLFSSFALYSDMSGVSIAGANAVASYHARLLEWCVGEYLRDASHMKDHLYRRREATTQDKLEALLEAAGHPAFARLVSAASGRSRAEQVLLETIAIFAAAGASTLRGSERSVWLFDVAVALSELCRRQDCEASLVRFCEIVARTSHIGEIGVRAARLLVSCRIGTFGSTPLGALVRRLGDADSALIVYGAGRLGAALIAFLRASSLTVEFAVDRTVTGECAGVPVRRPQELPQLATTRPVVLIAVEKEEVSLAISSWLARESPMCKTVVLSVEEIACLFAIAPLIETYCAARRTVCEARDRFPSLLATQWPPQDD
jgi:hypothetical protein